MAQIKFSELTKQTMAPTSITRSRKAAMKEIAAMELAELRDTLKVTQASAMQLTNRTAKIIRCLNSMAFGSEV